MDPVHQHLGPHRPRHRQGPGRRRQGRRGRAQQLKTSELNNLLAEIREGGHTRSEKGRRLKIQYCTQTGSKPPALSFWCNAPDLVDENFERFMENRIRERFELTGTPIRMRFRQKNEGGEK